MTKSSEYFKRCAENADNRFFGEGNKVKKTNKYFTYKHYIDNDTVIINTNNVKEIKGNPVLVVGKNEAVYLKDWNVRPAHNYGEICDDFYIVKLQRQYFRPYTFKTPFEDFCFDADEDFDKMVEIARAQDAQNMQVANGFMGF